MTRIFLPLDLNNNTQQIYCYINHSAKVVIARIIGLVGRHCERVIFPGEKFLFKADDNCELEISQQTNIGIIQDTIACSQLKVGEQSSQICL